jgi:hypothetical protein
MNTTRYGLLTEEMVQLLQDREMACDVSHGIANPSVIRLRNSITSLQTTGLSVKTVVRRWYSIDIFPFDLWV